jgi:hypothetical protein
MPLPVALATAAVISKWSKPVRAAVRVIWWMASAGRMRGMAGSSGLSTGRRFSSMMVRGWPAVMAQDAVGLDRSPASGGVTV